MWPCAAASGHATTEDVRLVKVRFIEYFFIIIIFFIFHYYFSFTFVILFFYLDDMHLEK